MDGEPTILEAIDAAAADVAILAGAENRAALDIAVWTTCTTGLESLWKHPGAASQLAEVCAVYAQACDLLEPVAWEKRTDLLPFLASLRLFHALAMLRAGLVEPGVKVLERAIEPMAMVARYGDPTGEAFALAVVISRRLSAAVSQGTTGEGQLGELLAMFS